MSCSSSSSSSRASPTSAGESLLPPFPILLQLVTGVRREKIFLTWAILLNEIGQRQKKSQFILNNDDDDNDDEDEKRWLAGGDENDDNDDGEIYINVGYVPVFPKHYISFLPSSPSNSCHHQYSFPSLIFSIIPPLFFLFLTLDLSVAVLVKSLFPSFGEEIPLRKKMSRDWMCKQYNHDSIVDASWIHNDQWALQKIWMAIFFFFLWASWTLSCVRVIYRVSSHPIFSRSCYLCMQLGEEIPSIFRSTFKLKVDLFFPMDSTMKILHHHFLSDSMRVSVCVKMQDGKFCPFLSFSSGFSFLFWWYPQFLFLVARFSSLYHVWSKIMHGLFSRRIFLRIEAFCSLRFTNSITVIQYLSYGQLRCFSLLFFFHNSSLAFGQN